MPVRRVYAQERAPRETADLVQAAQMDLSVKELRVDPRIDALRVELVDEDPPGRPPHLRQKQVVVGSDGEVALVRDQGSMREQEAERTAPKSSAAA